MKRIELRFEPDPALDHIEVLIRASEDDGQVASLRRLLSDPPADTLAVYDGHDNLRLVAAEDVVLISADGRVVRVVTESGRYYMKQSMRTLEDTLDAHRFVRISRYEIVNLAKVVSFDFTLAGTLRLELRGGMETWASRRCIPAIRRRLLGKE